MAFTPVFFLHSSFFIFFISYWGAHGNGAGDLYFDICAVNIMGKSCMLSINFSVSLIMRKYIKKSVQHINKKKVFPFLQFPCSRYRFLDRF